MKYYMPTFSRPLNDRVRVQCRSCYCLFHQPRHGNIHSLWTVTSRSSSICCQVHSRPRSLSSLWLLIVFILQGFWGEYTAMLATYSNWSILLLLSFGYACMTDDNIKLTEDNQRRLSSQCQPQWGELLQDQQQWWEGKQIARESNKWLWRFRKYLVDQFIVWLLIWHFFLLNTTPIKIYSQLQPPLNLHHHDGNPGLHLKLDHWLHERTMEQWHRNSHL